MTPPMTLKQRKVKAGSLLLAHLQDNSIVLADQRKAIADAKRNLHRYKKDEVAERVREIAVQAYRALKYST